MIVFGFSPYDVGNDMYEEVGTYNFEVPINITSVRVLLIGGGGRGGSGIHGGGGGGSGYVVVNDTYSVVPGSLIPVEVGYGNSSFGNIIAQQGGTAKCPNGISGYYIGGDGGSGGGAGNEANVIGEWTGHGGMGGSDGGNKEGYSGGKGQGDYTHLINTFKQTSFQAGRGGAPGKYTHVEVDRVFKKSIGGGGAGGILVNGTAQTKGPGGTQSGNYKASEGGEGFGAGGGGGGFQSNDGFDGANGLVYVEWD